MTRIISKSASVSEIDAGIKNKFNWTWLDHSIEVVIDGRKVNHKLGECIDKIDVAGKAKCSWCEDIINYGSKGRLALANHVVTAKHLKRLKYNRTNYNLGSSFSCGALSTGSSGSRDNAPKLVPIGDRVDQLQALVLGVLAENSLPFTMAPVIIETARALSSDPKAFDKLSMDRTTASYKMRFGLAVSFLQSTVENLQLNKFSLNLDESTSNNNQKVLAVLASYYSPEKQQVVIEHLASISVIRVNSESLQNEIIKIFTDYNIPWSNLMSMLMDSCSVMRGCRSGLETRIRSELAPHMLDIDGDVCHHVHNASKQFCKPFEYWVEDMYLKIHTDVKYCTDLRDALSQICFLLGIKFTMPERFISHRWLSVYDITVSTLRIWDALTIFYYAFLSKEDKLLYQACATSIYNQRDVSELARAEIRQIQREISKKKMTEDGSKRKHALKEKIFFKRKKTRCTMYFYSAALPLLKQYICLFESNTPMIHKLHDRQIELFRDFLACFMKPEVFADSSPRSLKKKLDIQEKTNHVPSRQMFIGKAAASLVSTSHKQDSTVMSFLESVEAAYVACACHLQKRLPVDNELIQCLSALDPIAQGHSLTAKNLLKLPGVAKNVLTAEEEEKFELEVRRFQVCKDLPPPSDENTTPVRLDSWWADVHKTGSFPSLCKMAFALMSCFHGPVVEGSFNTMGDILDPKSSRMKVETYSAVQTVKYGIRASGKSALQLFRRKEALHDPVNKRTCRHIRSSRKRYAEEQEKNRKVIEEKRQRFSLKAQNLQSKRKAKEALCKAEKTARLEHKQKMKARLEKLVAKRTKKN